MHLCCFPVTNICVSHPLQSLLQHLECDSVLQFLYFASVQSLMVWAPWTLLSWMTMVRKSIHMHSSPRSFKKLGLLRWVRQARLKRLIGLLWKCECTNKCTVYITVTTTAQLIWWILILPNFKLFTCTQILTFLNALRSRRLDADPSPPSSRKILARPSRRSTAHSTTTRCLSFISTPTGHRPPHPNTVSPAVSPSHSWRMVSTAPSPILHPTHFLGGTNWANRQTPGGAGQERKRERGRWKYVVNNMGARKLIDLLPLVLVSPRGTQWPGAAEQKPAQHM